MNDGILKRAIDTFGVETQLNIVIEECSELIKEICKMKRCKYNKLHMAEEIEDVEIMLEQLKIMYNSEKLVEVYKHRKLERLKERIDQVYK